jgi:hypothetical protein
MAVRRFVGTHAALAHTPLAGAVEELCRVFFGEGREKVAVALSDDEIVQMLRRVPPNVMETIIAKEIAELELGRVEILAVNTPRVDLVAFALVGGREISIGIQVKAGDRAFSIHDMPGSDELRPQFSGYVAMSVKKLGANAAAKLQRLASDNVHVYDWTGDALVARVRRNPSVLATVAEHAIKAPRSGLRRRKQRRQ